MRNLFGALSAVICVALAPGWTLGSDTHAAKRLDPISQFLTGLRSNRWPVRFYHLDRTNPIKPNAEAPGRTHVAKEESWPLTLASDYWFDEAREALVGALAVAPLSVPAPVQFVPDYCLVYKDAKKGNTVLWIDSAPSELQMQLCITNSACPLATSGIQIPTGGDGVRGALAKFLKVAASPPVKARPGVAYLATMLEANEFELMSVDPARVADVFGDKQWKILGKVSITDKESRTDVVSALRLLVLDPRLPPPAHTAHVFTPRLAISAHIPVKPNGARQRHTLLMSFECRLAELYIDHDFQGCCAINNGWQLTESTSGTTSGGLPDKPYSDQLLNDILVAAGKPLRAKSNSSSD